MVQHLRKLISSFHKDHSNKPTATSPGIDTAPPMAIPTIKPAEPPKQKPGRPANSTYKRPKNLATFDFYRIFGCIWVTSKSNILSRIACECKWLSADRFSQNFYFLTSSSLSHKTSMFLLELSLGQEVFHWQPFLLQQLLVFFLSLPSSGWEVFHQRHDPLRLISFPTGLGCSHFPWFSSSVSLIGLGSFSSSSYQ